MRDYVMVCSGKQLAFSSLWLPREPGAARQVAGGLKETVGTLKEKVGGIFSERYAASSVQRPACARLGTSRVRQTSALSSPLCCALSVWPVQTEVLCIM